MPRGHGWITSNTGNVAERRNRYLLRRSLKQHNGKLSSNEPQLSTIVLRTHEQSCSIITLVYSEHDSYWKLVALLQSLPGPDQGTTHSESPPPLIFLVNPHKEQHTTNLPENTCSPKSGTLTTLGMNVMGQSRNNNKPTESLKDSSNTSDSLSDSLSPAGSDILVSDSLKDEKPVKRGSKKKGKKKGKHSKRSSSKTVPSELESQCEESICIASVGETSTKCSSVCVDEKISETLVEDISTKKDEMDCWKSDICEPNSSNVETGVLEKNIVGLDNVIDSSVVNNGVTNDFHTAISGKRGRVARKLTSHTEKDHSNSVWQKVQKTETPKIETIFKGSDTRVRPNALPSFKQNERVKNGKHPCAYDLVGEPSMKHSLKVASNPVDSSESNVKKKPGSGAKQINQYLRKGSHSGNTNLAGPCKIDAQQKELNSTEKTDLCQLAQEKETEECMDLAASSVNSSSTMGEVIPVVECNQIGRSLSGADSLHPNREANTEGHFHDNNLKGYDKMNEDLYPMNSTDNRHSNSGTAFRKWVPMGRKNAALSHTNHIDNLAASTEDESAPNVLDSKHAEVIVSSNLQTEKEMLFSSQSCNDADCSSSKESNVDSTDEVIYPGSITTSKTVLGKIIQAVDDAHKMQTIADHAHLHGSSLAEFERFMHSASPVIGPRHHNGMCFHQKHNISLESLWQWYEEPGCYGLEVKAEDNRKSKRLRNGFVEFRAYFVPYLSALQLFARSDSSSASCCGEVPQFHKVDPALKPSSKLGPLPTFANRPCPSCFPDSASGRDKKMIEEEVIFEYFERALPQQRRPLFEKINELTRGERSPNAHMYGDPLNLKCLNLQDLHPASWYAVAWYPIYRIPDGNFRAAFLTYHSLGHFVHQSASSNMGGDFTRTIFPAVGLQSYNAQRECWFQPRDLMSIEVQKEKTSSLSPAVLLKERLKTLENSASVMAMAEVRKGDQISVNFHPDYDYFLRHRVNTTCFS